MTKRRILWANVITVLSTAVLIGTEVFGAGVAGGWAIGNLLGLGDVGTYLLQGTLLLLGVYIMVLFLRKAVEAEPFTTKE